MTAERHRDDDAGRSASLDTPALAYHLHALVGTVGRRAEAYLAPLGVTYTQYRILAVLAQHPGITGKRLAELLCLTPAAVSKNVRGMQDRGLVADTAARGEGNVQRLVSTEVGAALIARARRQLAAPLMAACDAAGVDAGELAESLRALHEATLALGPITHTDDEAGAGTTMRA